MGWNGSYAYYISSPCHIGMLVSASTLCKNFNVLYLSYYQGYLLQNEMDKFLSIKRGTHKTRTGNYQSIFDTIMPLFCLGDFT